MLILLLSGPTSILDAVSILRYLGCDHTGYASHIFRRFGVAC